MRVAFVSPMPPARSGIADYSAALVQELGKLVEIEVIAEPPGDFDPGRFDSVLYQVGNNPYHVFVYRMALEYPGVVVLHEANLHHLVTELTINQDDWDGYVKEAEYNGGLAARDYAERVRARAVGPDYEGLPMTRRLFESARGLIVHSACVERTARAGGFQGPIARIPHGAWIPEADRWAYRDRLGLDPTAPLVGIFGFLKPYKRIAESLRAFRRVVKLEPRARMILVGEVHPDFAVHSLIAALGLTASVRVLGYTPIEDFVGYLAACDVVLNLRYPTVGESSGTLLRALGLSRPVLVSDVGSFRDLPDEICLKVPVDVTEEAQIFEFLRLLIARPELGLELGSRGRRWIERECTWEVVARRYAEFLEQVACGAGFQPAAGLQPGPPGGSPAAAPKSRPTSTAENPIPEVVEWLPPKPALRAYVSSHQTRFAKTLEMIPPGRPEDRILEMGSYLQITPSLKLRLGYGEVRGCYFGPAGATEFRTATTEDGRAFTCAVDLFDAESDPFPYPDEHFSTVLCCEIIEHLVRDPMHMVAEINRVLRTGGHLVLTTPNIVSLRAVSAILQGYHPGFFPQYIKPAHDGTVDPRHSREYAPREIHELLDDAGFEVVRLETGPFRDQPTPEVAWVRRLLERYELRADLRDEGIYVLGRKTGPVKARYPAWLYV